MTGRKKKIKFSEKMVQSPLLRLGKYPEQKIKILTILTYFAYDITLVYK